MKLIKDIKNKIKRINNYKKLWIKYIKINLKLINYKMMNMKYWNQNYKKIEIKKTEKN